MRNTKQPPADADILAAVRKWGNRSMTYVIRNVLAGDFPNHDIKTKPFRNHIRTAMESEQARTRAARRLPAVQTGAMLRNSYRQPQGAQIISS